MSRLVVDASVAAKWFLPEEHADAALTILDDAHQLHAPDFLLLEMDSLLCKWIHRGVITPAEAQTVRDAVRRIPIRIHPAGSLQDAAFHIAVRARISIYDSLYLALAVLTDGRTVTADRRLYNSLARGPLAKHALWVEDV
jgi:predicted nucleic acid-binding protein